MNPDKKWGELMDKRDKTKSAQMRMGLTDVSLKLSRLNLIQMVIVNP